MHALILRLLKQRVDPPAAPHSGLKLLSNTTSAPVLQSLAVQKAAELQEGKQVHALILRLLKQRVDPPAASHGMCKY